MFARANNADEHSPCAIIRVKALFQPQEVLDIIPAVNSPICPTDEYAINDFKSVCRKQINLVIHAPHRAILEISGVNK